MNETTHRSELKVQALLEKVGNLTSNYESQIADARVEITLLNNELGMLRQQLADQAGEDVSEEEVSGDSEVEE